MLLSTVGRYMLAARTLKFAKVATMCIDMCIDMHVDMCADMCADMSVCPGWQDDEACRDFGSLSSLPVDRYQLLLAD